MLMILSFVWSVDVLGDDHSPVTLDLVPENLRDHRFECFDQYTGTGILTQWTVPKCCFHSSYADNLDACFHGDKSHFDFCCQPPRTLAWDYLDHIRPSIPWAMRARMPKIVASLIKMEGMTLHLIELIAAVITRLTMPVSQFGSKINDAIAEAPFQTGLDALREATRSEATHGEQNISLEEFFEQKKGKNADVILTNSPRDGDAGVFAGMKVGHDASDKKYNEYGRWGVRNRKKNSQRSKTVEKFVKRIVADSLSVPHSGAKSNSSASDEPKRLSNPSTQALASASTQKGNPIRSNAPPPTRIDKLEDVFRQVSNNFILRDEPDLDLSVFRALVDHTIDVNAGVTAFDSCSCVGKGYDYFLALQQEMRVFDFTTPGKLRQQLRLNDNRAAFQALNVGCSRPPYMQMVREQIFYTDYFHTLRCAPGELGVNLMSGIACLVEQNLPFAIEFLHLNVMISTTYRCSLHDWSFTHMTSVHLLQNAILLAEKQWFDGHSWDMVWADAFNIPSIPVSSFSALQLRHTNHEETPPWTRTAINWESIADADRSTPSAAAGNTTDARFYMQKAEDGDLKLEREQTLRLLQAINYTDHNDSEFELTVLSTMDVKGDHRFTAFLQSQPRAFFLRERLKKIQNGEITDNADVPMLASMGDSYSWAEENAPTLFENGRLLWEYYRTRNKPGVSSRPININLDARWDFRAIERVHTHLTHRQRQDQWPLLDVSWASRLYAYPGSVWQSKKKTTSQIKQQFLDDTEFLSTWKGPDFNKSDLSEWTNPSELRQALTLFEADAIRHAFPSADVFIDADCDVQPSVYNTLNYASLCVINNTVSDPLAKYSSVWGAQTDKGFYNPKFYGMSVLSNVENVVRIDAESSRSNTIDFENLNFHGDNSTEDTFAGSDSNPLVVTEDVYEAFKQETRGTLFGDSHKASMTDRMMGAHAHGLFLRTAIKRQQKLPVMCNEWGRYHLWANTRDLTHRKIHRKPGESSNVLPHGPTVYAPARSLTKEDEVTPATSKANAKSTAKIVPTKNYDVIDDKKYDSDLQMMRVAERIRLQKLNNMIPQELEILDDTTWVVGVPMTEINMSHFLLFFFQIFARAPIILGRQKLRHLFIFVTGGTTESCLPGGTLLTFSRWYSEYKPFLDLLSEEVHVLYSADQVGSYDDYCGDPMLPEKMLRTPMKWQRLGEHLLEWASLATNNHESKQKIKKDIEQAMDIEINDSHILEYREYATAEYQWSKSREQSNAIAKEPIKKSNKRQGPENQKQLDTKIPGENLPRDAKACARLVEKLEYFSSLRKKFTGCFDKVYFGQDVKLSMHTVKHHKNSLIKVAIARYLVVKALVYPDTNVSPPHRDIFHDDDNTQELKIGQYLPSVEPPPAPKYSAKKTNRNKNKSGHENGATSDATRSVGQRSAIFSPQHPHILLEHIDAENYYMGPATNWKKRMVIFLLQRKRFDTLKALHLAKMTQQENMENGAVEVEEKGTKSVQNPLKEARENQTKQPIDIYASTKNGTFSGDRAFTDEQMDRDLRELSENLQDIAIILTGVFEDLTIEQQLCVAYHSKVFLGSHGAGLAWALLMKPRVSAILEVMPNKPDLSIGGLCNVQNRWNENPVTIYGGTCRIAQVHHRCVHRPFMQRINGETRSEAIQLMTENFARVREAQVAMHIDLIEAAVRSAPWFYNANSNAYWLNQTETGEPPPDHRDATDYMRPDFGFRIRQMVTRKF